MRSGGRHPFAGRAAEAPRQAGICLALLLAAAPAWALPAFKIGVREEGVYGVRYEDLPGLDGALRPAVGGLGLTWMGEPVPVWVEDGGDGRFDPGDWIEFIGRHLSGEVSHFDPHADQNVYRLRFDVERPARMAPRSALREAPAGEPVAVYRARHHIERDQLLLRFPETTADQDELWYWARLTPIQQRPFELRLDLKTASRRSPQPISLALELRGWSRPRRSSPEAPTDHRVEVLINGELVAAGEWNSDAKERIEVPSLPREKLRFAEDVLTVRVPQRSAPSRDGGDEPLVDVSVLNWIEVTFPRHAALPSDQVRLGVPLAQGRRVGTVVTESELPVTVYGDDGSRVSPAAMLRRRQPDGRYRHLFHLPEGAGTELYAVPGDRLRAPSSVALDRESDLRAESHRADYIIIGHARLLDAVEPLAELHRRRGIEVMVVDVEDVYDEFHHGILHPRAIRDFLRHAHERWQPPGPRFVLLVGDASWDTKNEVPDDELYAAWTYRPDHPDEFGRVWGAPYAQATPLAHRNLIPTWSFSTGNGHAASDNRFVTFADGDMPEMAIGRLPVTEPAEVEAISAKTVAYVEAAETGPWRRDILWISDGSSGRDRTGDLLAGELSLLGFSGTKVVPDIEAPAASHQERLLEALDRGQLLVHFTGHGGRFIWRTAPADFEANRDLFTLDDLERLRKHHRLPVVLSMTCYSAPFDHPSADSIGEKFLRLPDRGAVAVIAASWRNSASRQMSEALVAELTRPGTVGESLMRAKRASSDPVFQNLYNLLGDPALPLALPPLDVRLEALGGPLPEVVAEVRGEPFAGAALIEWADRNGDLLLRQEVEVQGPRFRVRWPGPGSAPPDLAAVRLYVRDSASGLDGIAGAAVGVESERLHGGL